MPKIRAIHIDALNQAIKEVHIECRFDVFQHFIGGLFCIGWRYLNGDAVYVDDEGRSKPVIYDGEEFEGYPYGFLDIKGRPEPLYGSGLLVGPPVDGYESSARVSVAEMTRRIRFWKPGTVLIG